MTFLDMWVTGGGNNDTGWGSEKYDELITGAQARWIR
jgi:oligopeptide transport system substrate-binding protein